MVGDERPANNVLYLRRYGLHQNCEPDRKADAATFARHSYCNWPARLSRQR